jgi:hypothetical protein
MKEVLEERDCGLKITWIRLDYGESQGQNKDHFK